MVQVNVENEHVSTGISGDEFFITPKAVDPVKFETLVPESATGTQPVTEIYTTTDYNYIGTNSPPALLKLDNSDGSILWDIEPSGFSNAVRNIESGPSGGVLATDGATVLSIASDGTVNWSASDDCANGPTGIAVTPAGNIIVTGKLLAPDGTKLRSWTINDSGYVGAISNTDGTFGLQYESSVYDNKNVRVRVFIEKFDATDSTSAGSVSWSTLMGSNETYDTANSSGGITNRELRNSNIFFSNTGDISYSIESYASDGSSTTLKTTGFVGVDGGVKSTNNTVLYGFSQDSDGAIYGIESGFIRKYETPSLNTILREIDVPNEKFELISADNHVHANGSKEVVRLNYSQPTVENATYKLNLSGTGPIQIDGLEVIPSGTTETLESFVDSGVRIDGNCFISGVQVK